MPRPRLGARLVAKLRRVNIRVSKMLYIQVNRRTLGRVSKPAAQLRRAKPGDDDDEDLILCRYSVAESTGVSGTVGPEYIPV